MSNISPQAALQYARRMNRQVQDLDGQLAEMQREMTGALSVIAYLVLAHGTDQTYRIPTDELASMQAMLRVKQDEHGVTHLIVVTPEDILRAKEEQEKADAAQAGKEKSE